MKIFDSHIHLFEKPYSDVFCNAHIKDGREGEFSLFQEYRRKFDITGAFVICYEDGQCPRNNRYVESLREDWIYSFGHIIPQPSAMAQSAVELKERGHFGLSCYLDRNDDCGWLASSQMSGFWSFLCEHRMPLSLNLSAFQCRAVGNVLARYPSLTVLLSHMARPKLVHGQWNKDDYAPVLELAQFPSVYIKLSGFYAFVENGWRYPQSDLFPVVAALKEAFGAKRLLFASDFPPVLEYNSYFQAVELLRKECGCFTSAELEAVYWKNALDIVKMTEDNNGDS